MDHSSSNVASMSLSGTAILDDGQIQLHYSYPAYKQLFILLF
jgi:hypothetical protein